jgi:hypothetical protein
VSRPFEIRRQVALPAPPEEVWRAIATPGGQAGWFMTTDPPDAAGAEVVEDPPHRLEQRFGTQAIEYVVEADDGGTAVLRFVHSGVLDGDWGGEFGGEFETMTGFGWDMYLFTLGEYLRHFPGRPAVYAEAQAPAEPDAWARIRAALGDPSEGRTVTTPVGAGVVDVSSEHYLGVRTATALLRFHERSLIGMPVAVGHHEMTPGADAAALTTTWTAWLAATTKG